MATIQPQGMVTMTTTPQLSVAMPTYNQLGVKDATLKKVIRGLAVCTHPGSEESPLITEIVLGIISILAGVIVTGIVSTSSPRYYYFPLFGEGIWGGAFVIIAGGIGVPAGGVNASLCLINTHMAFSIFGAVVSILQFSFGVVSSILHYSEVTITFLVLIDLAAMLSLILLIVSACFCCCVIPGCCNCNETPQTQVLYVTNDAQQAATMQGVPGTNQGYIVQGHQPTSQVQPRPIAAPSPPFSPADGSYHLQHPRNIEAVQTKEEESTLPSTQHRVSDPPPYST